MKPVKNVVASSVLKKTAVVAVKTATLTRDAVKTATLTGKELC